MAIKISELNPVSSAQLADQFETNQGGVSLRETNQQKIDLFNQYIHLLILSGLGTTQQIAINRGYIADNASLVTFTLPATAAVGDYFEIIGKRGAGGWQINQAAGQYCVVGKQKSITGVGGNIASTDPSDGIRLVCTIANTEFTASPAPQGNISIT